MITLDKESELLERYRSFSIFDIKCIGNMFSCLKIVWLTRSKLYRKSWINSSGSKKEVPPDYHNDKLHIMIEMMRVDDCIGILNNEHVPNAFEKEGIFCKRAFGENYKKKNVGVTLIFVPNTDDPTKYTYDGYLKKFENVLLKHSNKIEKYKSNYPKCNKIIFFISDESNEFCETSNLDDKDKVEKGIDGVMVNWHIPYMDKRFIEIIKKCKCDYIIWFQHYKNMKRMFKLLVPRVIILDVKHFKLKGIDYDAKFMAKVKEVHNYDRV